MSGASKRGTLNLVALGTLVREEARAKGRLLDWQEIAEIVAVAQHQATLDWARGCVNGVVNPYDWLICYERSKHAEFERCRKAVLDALEKKEVKDD